MFFFSAVASVLKWGGVVADYLFVVVADYSGHVRHAAVADFYVVLVEDTVELVFWGEVLLDEV